MTRTAIIMCVRKPGDGYDFMRSVGENCGQDSFIDEPAILFEVVDASGMGDGYNKGLTLSAEWEIANNKGFDTWVFTHQDVTMWAGRKLWEDALKKTLEDGVGFVGVAGGQELGPDGGWWSMPTTPRGTCGAVAHTGPVFQATPAGLYRGDGTYMSSFGPYGECIVMDGVFLACSRKTLEAIGPWPEDLGWHFYDVWATRKAHKAGLRNYVVPLPLHHVSVGEVRGDWTDSRDLYLSKYA